MNMGTMLIIFVFYLALFVVYPCCRALRHDAKCAKRNTKKIGGMLFWSHPIVFLQEGYLDILITATINIIFVRDGLEWNTTSLVITNALSLFMLASCAFLFLFSAFYLWPRFDSLKKKRFKS
mmetsp:Transcript_27747/g.34486  ORF Transcript_27747/g.34486 Transcript_27747/m.34486 type:complete len:122 (+) Transcript_27747:1115-1480(+)